MSHTFTKTPLGALTNLSAVVDTHVSVSTEAEILTDVIAAFEDYLRGCGYYFDGHLDLVYDESTPTIL